MSLERQCTDSCAHEHERGGGALLDRVDLSPLHAPSRAIARIPSHHRHAAVISAGEMTSGGARVAAPRSCAMPSCTTRLPLRWRRAPRATDSFAAAGLANEQTLQLFMPLSRYKRLLGAAQPAFELTLSHGVGVGAPPRRRLVLQPLVLAQRPHILRRFNPRLVCGRGGRRRR